MMADNLMHWQRKSHQLGGAEALLFHSRSAVGCALVLLCTFTPGARASQDIPSGADRPAANGSLPAKTRAADSTPTARVRVEVRGPKVSVFAQGASLRQTLEAIAEATDFRLQLLSGFTDARISAELVDISARETFVRLLKDYHHVLVEPGASTNLSSKMLIVGSRAAATPRLGSPKNDWRGRASNSLAPVRAALLEELAAELPPTDGPVANGWGWVTPPDVVQQQVEESLLQTLAR